MNQEQVKDVIKNMQDPDDEVDYFLGVPFKKLTCKEKTKVLYLMYTRANDSKEFYEEIQRDEQMNKLPRKENHIDTNTINLILITCILLLCLFIVTTS